MDELVMILTAFGGTVGFSILFQVKPTHILPAAFGGALTCSIYLLCLHLELGLFFANFVASLGAVIYSGILARCLKTPSSIFVSLCVISLVPGSSLFYTMQNLLAWDAELFLPSLARTLQMALGIAGGIGLESAVGHLLGQLRKKRASSRKI